MNINTIKSTYGYLGFTPFALFSITPWITGGYIGETAIIFQIAYGSIILTFLGGISWGWRDDQPAAKEKSFNWYSLQSYCLLDVDFNLFKYDSICFIDISNKFPIFLLL